MSGRRPDVFVGVASIPSRAKSLKKVIERLLPQAAQIGVYLNGYDDVPLFLRRSGRIEVARSQDHGDLRDNGKFFFLDKSQARYYATVDDDILYPHDYLRHLVDSVNVADRHWAVGVHAAYYPSPVVELFEPRVLLHFEDASPHLMPVHLLGTGTVLFDQSDWHLELSEFGKPGMADVWFARAAARRDASLFSVPRVRNWVTAVDRFGEGRTGGALFFEGLLDSSHQVSVLREALPAKGGFESLMHASMGFPRFVEELSVHQAMHLDLIRTQLGHPPMSDRTALELGDALETRAKRWAAEHPITEDVGREFGRLVVDVLADRVDASSAESCLVLLDRLGSEAADNPTSWLQLPAALRYDSSPDRVESLQSQILDRGVHHSKEDAARLWGRFGDRVNVTLSTALQVERASVHTGFERLPTLAERVRENPESATARLYDYFEASGWRNPPDEAGLRLIFGAEYESFEIQMLVCVGAARSGQMQVAKQALERLRRSWPWDRDVHLLEASLASPRSGSPMEMLAPVLDVLDGVLRTQGISPYRDLVGDRGDAAHWIHQLRSVDGSAHGVDGDAPDVSVLMTTHNDEATIGAAIGSVLASGGVDLQLIVVDDASTDDTIERVAAFDDPRVTLIRNEVNVGPYLSRNHGLEQATGRYIAIADADDWSHPQRLSYQAAILDESPHLLACKVAHIRVQPNGTIDLENHMRFIGDGPVTVMFRRWLLDHIGGFDHVRTRGDIEYMRRITARFGEGALASFETPLVVATSNPSSNSKRFREESLNIYRAGARKWHEQRALSDALYVPLRGERAPFTAPNEILAERQMPG